MLQKRKIGAVLFGLYGILMLWLLFFQSARIPDYNSGDYWLRVAEKQNFIPFRTIGSYLDVLLRKDYHMEQWGLASVYNYHARQAVINLFGNVGMFLPLGFCLPWVFPKLQKLSKTLLAALGIIGLVEVLQLFTLLGSCDVDDLILNLMGVAVGYGIFVLCATIQKEPA